MRTPLETARACALLLFSLVACANGSDSADGNGGASNAVGGAGATATPSSGAVSAAGTRAGATSVSGASGAATGGGASGTGPSGGTAAGVASGGTLGGSGAATAGSSAGNAAGAAGLVDGIAGSAGAGGNAAAAGLAGTGRAGASGASGGAGRGGATGTAGTGGAAGAFDPCPANGDPCKILPLGDSITDGFNIPGGYRIPLFRKALMAGKKLTFVGSSANGPQTVDGTAFPRNHEGHSGYTIDNAPAINRSGISPLTNAALTTHTPHVVLLMIGTNDVNNNNELATAPARLGALMDRILAARPQSLLVVSAIVPTRLPAVNIRVAAYNAAIAGLVSERAARGAHIVSIDAESAFEANANYSSQLLADDLHPNAAGYAVIADTWYTAIGSYLH